MKAKVDKFDRLCLTAKTKKDKAFIKKMWEHDVLVQSVNSGYSDRYSDLKIQLKRKK